MNRLTDNLYYFTAFALLAAVAVMLAFKWGRYEGHKAAYEVSLEQCQQRYPRYRCEVELARYFEVSR